MTDDPTDIRAFLRLNERTTTSGRLLPGDPARLAAIGVRHVINLALHEHPEALPNESAEMARAGLRYTNIPIPFDAPTEDHYLAFRAAYEAGPEPVHVHCIMNQRVSAFFYRYHSEQGMPEPDARALLEQIWRPHEIDDPHAGAWAMLIDRKASDEIIHSPVPIFTQSKPSLPSMKTAIRSRAKRSTLTGEKE